MMPSASAELDLVQAGALVGAVLPIVAAVLKQDRLGRRANTTIVASVALVAAIVTAIANDATNPRDVIATFAVTYATAVAFYHGLWRPTGIAHAVQSRTSMGPRVPAPSQAASIRPERRTAAGIRPDVDRARC